MKYQVFIERDGKWVGLEHTIWPLKEYALRSMDVWHRLGWKAEVREIEGEDSQCHDS